MGVPRCSREPMDSRPLGAVKSQTPRLGTRTQHCCSCCHGSLDHRCYLPPPAHPPSFFFIFLCLFFFFCGAVVIVVLVLVVIVLVTVVAHDCHGHHDLYSWCLTAFSHTPFCKTPFRALPGTAGLRRDIRPGLNDANMSHGQNHNGPCELQA